jgi:TrkA domain protein
VAGRTIGDSHIRSTTGASIVAISRAGRVIPNPGPEQPLLDGDRVALFGTPAQVQEAERLFAPLPTEPAPEAVSDVSTVDAR